MLENDNFLYAGEIMKDLIDKISTSENQDRYRVFDAWEEIVGASVAVHVSPSDIRGETLILEADHPGWTQKVLLNQRSILKRIQNKYPQLRIKRIRVIVGNE